VGLGLATYSSVPGATAQPPQLTAATTEAEPSWSAPPLVVQPLGGAAATAGPPATLIGLDASLAIPVIAQSAYRAAAARQPRCRLDWSVLAGIGLIESRHARAGGSTNPAWPGIANPPIVGPQLVGGPYQAIPDTDDGRLDGDRLWDRAVGPMQFLPATWRKYGVDADGDRVTNPQDIRDASAASAAYLCAAGGDLSVPQSLASAVFAYNHDVPYVRDVLTAAAQYGGGTTVAAALALLPAPSPSPSATPTPSTGSPAAPVTPQSPAAESPRSPSPKPRPEPTPEPTTTPAPTPAPTSAGETATPTPTASAPTVTVG
jgi:hypothetical protein